LLIASPAFARRPVEVVLELTGVLYSAPTATIAGGGAARIAASTSYLGASVGVGALSPSSIPLSIGSTRLYRVPFDVCMRGGIHVKWFEVIGEFGLGLAALVLDRDDLVFPVRRTVLEIGVRGQVLTHFWLSTRLALLAAVEATTVTSPPSFALIPDGFTGQTPKNWVQGALGLVVRLY